VKVKYTLIDGRTPSGNTAADRALAAPIFKLVLETKIKIRTYILD
jgi:hypothetical protein